MSAERPAPDHGTAPTTESPIGRIPVLDVSPRIADGPWPARAFAGEVVPFAATAFREGHELIGVELLLTAPDGTETAHRMRSLGPGTDRWTVEAVVPTAGDWSFRIRAFADDYASWQHVAGIKIPADQDVAVTLAAGAEILRRAAAESDRDAEQRALLTATAKKLTTARTAAGTRLASATAPAIVDALTAQPLRRLSTLSPALGLRVERRRAGHGAWYEFFPRSEGAVHHKDGSWTSGTFRTAAKRLPAVAAMGFDVLYLPPIHPIGTSHRKGPNNTLTAAEGDPGSPWAIGGPAGGHDAIHPDLGTEKDFAGFVAAVQRNGLELALDLALQASPDHPWVTEHPEWFTQRPDGTIAYAENPPKRYQDIYPVNFDRDPEGIRTEVLRIVRLWISRGVTIFRVDNPHTKPLDFWEWLIATVNAEHPDVVFLAEAFTRPALLQGLATIGFQQSYNYFAWRNTKEELEEYLAELTTGTVPADPAERGTAEFLRPNLWVNTPDILTEYLQHGGEPAYRIRAALAATAAPLWGMYAGYELVENVARPGSEENIDNEKYEYKARPWAAAEKAGRSLAPYITALNRIRREHPALGQLRNLRLHWSDDEQVLVYSKHLAAEHSAEGRNDIVLVVVNLDPHRTRETSVHLDPRLFGLPSDAVLPLEDLLTGERRSWTSAHNRVHLDPAINPVMILALDSAAVR